ncbi:MULTISPECIES: malonate decarboxylase subunit delta [Peribacillus]|uniref:Malonate decarboxylase acyl carrier protein n=1 Tax=Peribacillus simplex TaxID=1478 RepID=A0A120GP40_9BACI|nr:malonate decarboxylase subunit delta [Peribacillus simplex]KWW17284.1 malonate decarboxylase acyl carrier protein [Peribacillus simplex]
MEKITYTFPATRKIAASAHVGVVGSGDLEVMMEPSDVLQAEVIIRTGIMGYQDTWKAVIHRFFTQHDFAAKVKINDFGATPGVVAIRLAQALEVSFHDSKIN